MSASRSIAQRLADSDATLAPVSAPSRAPTRVGAAGPVAGFTLIELMVTLLVIAVLAAIAQATYTQQVRRGNRSAAEAFLMDTATREQQYFLDVRSYADIPTLGVAIPQQVANAYLVTAVPAAGPPPGFTVTAVPQGNQTPDSCGTLTINDAGVKTPANCW